VIVRIDDVADPRLSSFADMRTRRIDPAWAGDDAAASYDIDDTFVVEGRWCVQQLAQSAHATTCVVVQDGRQDEVTSWFGDQVPIYVVSAARIRELVGFDFHRGMLACGKRPTFRGAGELVNDLIADGGVALCVLGVSQQDNLGSMIRTAMAMGIDRLAIGPKTADPLSRRAIRVSMGTVFGQTIYRLDDPPRDLAAMTSVRTVVTTLSPDATPLGDFVVDDRPIVLVVGSEPDGVAGDVEAAATDRVTIPMKLGTDSLNVSVAAGIFMYALTVR
jgi:tRNA G18 (ribose-2'-O)-methylase SpoU